MLGDSYGAGIVYHLSKAELDKQDRDKEEAEAKKHAKNEAVQPAILENMEDGKPPLEGTGNDFAQPSSSGLYPELGDKDNEAKV